MIRDPFDDAERELRLERDFEREQPRRPRQTTFAGFVGEPRAPSTRGAAGCPAPTNPALCYACDARAIGTRDRRPEGGRLEQACARHADRLAGVLNPPVKTGGAR